MNQWIRYTERHTPGVRRPVILVRSPSRLRAPKFVYFYMARVVIPDRQYLVGQLMAEPELSLVVM